MKAFVAITLLAACAAAQTFDYQTGLRQHLLKKELGLTNGVYDTLRNVNTYNTVEGVNTLSLDEIIRHPLFQTYYTLPLFRQHFTHPQFQVYLTTPYFQKFWTHPIFPTFFRSSHLFYKFIYPVVYNTLPTGVQYDREYDFGVNTHNIFGDYKNFPFNSVDSTNVLDHVQYSHVLEKIFKHLLVNKPEILEVKTDVKVHTTPVEETSFVKRVDPVTGEVKYVVDETVEKKVFPIDVINTIRKPEVYDNELIKEALLKKIFLNKVLYGDRVERVLPEVYNLHKNIYGDRVVPSIYNHYNKYQDVDTILNRGLFNKYQSVYPRELYNTVYPREFLNKYNTILPREFLNKYNTVVPQYDSILRRELINKYETIPREFVNKYETVYPRDLVNKYETTYPREFVNKYESIYPRDLVNKYESIIPRDLVNKYETILPREYQSVLPRHLINKYETENKLETILKNIVA